MSYPATSMRFLGLRRRSTFQLIVCCLLAPVVMTHLSDIDDDASQADVLKARLKTTGVVEHTFVINTGHSKGVQWRIYDVGGARGQRQAWAPYFDDGKSYRMHLDHVERTDVMSVFVQ